MNLIDDESHSPLSEGEDFYEDMLFWADQFMEYKNTQRSAAKTIKSYREALDSFLSFCRKHKNEITMESLGARFVNRYLIEYQSSIAILYKNRHKRKSEYDEVIKQPNQNHFGKNDALFLIHEDFQSSLSHRLTVVKMLLRYISQNNEQEHDYTHLFPKFATIKIKNKITDYVTMDEVDQVIDLMGIWIQVYKTHKSKSSIASAYRDSLMILLYVLTGARSEEVVKIKLEDITEMELKKEKYYRVKIKEAKGGKQREVAVRKEFIANHIEYLASNLPDREYYLSSVVHNGAYINKNMHQNNIRTFGNFVLKLLGVNKSGLHTFRRGYATKRVVVDGVDISIVAKEMGNSSAVMEKFYLKHEVGFAAM